MVDGLAMKSRIRDHESFLDRRLGGSNVGFLARRNG